MTQVVVGNILEVEAPDLLEPDDSQACVESVQFANLDVRPVYVIRVIR